MDQIHPNPVKQLIPGTLLVHIPLGVPALNQVNFQPIFSHENQGGSKKQSLSQIMKVARDGSPREVKRRVRDHISDHLDIAPNVMAINISDRYIYIYIYAYTHILILYYIHGELLIPDGKFLLTIASC